MLDPDATWHLFVGYNSFVPAALSMAEAAPTDATVLLALDIAGPADEPDRAISAAHTTLHFTHRNGGRADDASRLLDALGRIELPAGPGHAYVGAEMGVMRAISAALQDRGLPDDGISAKPYWRYDHANARHGGTDRG